MRLMYWYALTPVVVVFGGLVFLTIPFLALAVLTIAALGALAGLAWAIVAVPYVVGRAISRRWHDHGAGPRTAAAVLDNSLAARSHAQPVVHISLDD